MTCRCGAGVRLYLAGAGWVWVDHLQNLCGPVAGSYLVGVGCALVNFENMVRVWGGFRFRMCGVGGCRWKLITHTRFYCLGG